MTESKDGGAAALPANTLKPALTVRYADLRRVRPCRWMAHCPACEGGLLAVQRDNSTFEIMAHDRCLKCGQSVFYADVAEMRALDQGQTGDLTA